MHHAHAANAGAKRQANEFAEGLAGFVGAQAVQVELALNAPVSAAQLVGHVRADAGAAKAQLVVGVQQGADVEGVAERLEHHAAFVEFALLGDGFCRLGGVPEAVSLPLDGLHRADGVAKQVLLRPGLAPGLLQRALALGFALGSFRKGLPERLEVGKGAGFQI